MVKRRRDADGTRDAILKAAQTAFSQKAYAAVGVREITAAAGANIALVNRYFGSKEKLFEQAIAELLDPAMLTRAPRDNFGKALVASFLEPHGGRVNPLQIMVLATSDAGARAITDTLLRDQIIEPLSRWFDRPNAAERAARLVLLASGFFLYRLLYPLEAWSGDLAPASRSWLEQAFQSVIDDPR